jgi:GntR family transcriptional regulator
MKEYIEKNSVIPYYLQLKNIIERNIDEGNFPDGRIFSEHEAEKVFNVSNVTVKRAFFELQKEGRIYRTKGVGTFVKQPKFEFDPTKFMSMGKVLKNKGFIEEIKVIKKEILESKKIKCEEDKKIKSDRTIYIERLRYINNEPVVLERLFFDYDMCKGIIENAENKMIFDYLRKNLKINITKIDEYLEPIILNPEESDLLDIKNNSAALLIRKIIRDNKERNIVYNKTIIRGDKCSYHIQIQ